MALITDPDAIWSMHNYQAYDTLPKFCLDLETSIKNRGPDAVGKFKASPFHPSNHVVWYGVSKPQMFNINQLRIPDTDIHTSVGAGDVLKCMEGGKVMIGQNIKFDLLHLMMDGWYHQVLDFFRDGGMIWDVMQVEYLLSGQQSQFMNLDRLSMKYGGTVKDSRLKEYWDRGIDTEDIPQGEIVPYLREDVRNTGIVYAGQIAEVKLRGDAFMRLIQTQMKAMVTTLLIEYNGIHFDVMSASDVAKELAEEHEDVDESLKEFMYMHVKTFNKTGYFTPFDMMNPNSKQQLSAILLGGDFTFTAPVVQRDEHGNKIKYKTGARKGQFKTKKESVTISVGALLPEDFKELSTENTTGWRIDETFLKKALKKCQVGRASKPEEVIRLLLQHRRLEKELKVSYIGLLELVWPTDQCIHGAFNHCATFTGRLSSSAPNQQNFSSREIEE